MAEIDFDEWFQRIARHVQQTPPRCLGGFSFPAPKEPQPWADSVAWPLTCSCGGTTGQFLGYPSPSGDWLLSPLAFRCSKCAMVTDVFDSNRHGYNSEIGSGGGCGYPLGTGEPTAFACPKCSGTDFSVSGHFMHSHFDIIEDEPELEPRAQDFFDSVDFRGTCTGCGATVGFANFETA